MFIVMPFPVNFFIGAKFHFAPMKLLDNGIAL
jgi:hypothetical protein